MNDSEEVPICGADRKHNFYSIKAAPPKANPPYNFFMRCSFCPAILHQTVTVKVDASGNARPIVSTFLIFPTRTVELKTRVETTPNP